MPTLSSRPFLTTRKDLNEYDKVLSSKLHNGTLTYRGGYIDHINKDDIIHVIVAEGVTRIKGQERMLTRKGAFFNCPNLLTVTLSNSCVKVGNLSLENCLNLLTINNIHRNVTKISYRAFTNCKSLINIRLPSTCRSVCPEAFIGCDALVVRAKKKGFSSNVEAYLRYRSDLPKLVYSYLLAFNRADKVKAANNRKPVVKKEDDVEEVRIGWRALALGCKQSQLRALDSKEDDGIGESDDFAVAIYRSIGSADIWRHILGYVKV